MQDKLYYITFSSPEYKSLGEYLFDPASTAHIYQDNPNRFLNIVGEDNLTNADRIISLFREYEINKLVDKGIIVRSKNYTDLYKYNYTYEVKDIFKLPVKLGTLLYLEYDVVNQNASLTEGIEIVTNNEPAFKAAQLAKLEADNGYMPVHKPVSGRYLDGSFKNSFPNITVWIWCRAISDYINENELTGELINITPFIQRCSTNMGKNGGNFQITLPPIECVLDVKNKWGLRPKTVHQSGNGEYFAESSLFSGTDSNGDLIRSQFLFNNIIKANDLVFIRFETLELDKEQRYKDAEHFFVDKSMLAGRNYDMIGLIDRNTQTITPGNNDVTTNIGGKDLMKTFIDDGTYFYALENSEGLLKIGGETRIKNTLLNRNYADGGLYFTALYDNKPIDYVLKFIMQQLSNLKVVPSDLFTSYGDRVNKTFNVLQDSGKISANTSYKPQNKQENANGIWQIVKLIIDKGVYDRRLADSSMSTANGSLINFIRKACQEPFVEFYGDTYGDMYYLTVRKPPFDKEGLLSLLKGNVSNEENIPLNPPVIDIDGNDVLREILSMDDTQVYSWYHLIPTTLSTNSTFNPSTYVLPAAFFDEYAQVFGAKVYEMANNYIPFIPYNDTSNTLWQTQNFYDLKYVIESTQYLPFTRKGTLILNGDRRIKIGNIIRYKPTGEIFFVEGVNQTINISERGIERTTTVEVTRGLVEKLIYGTYVSSESGSSEWVSYFDIINTELNLDRITVMGKQEVTAPVMVKDVFVSGSTQIGNLGYAAPGFNEYFQHQQGAWGARQIVDSCKTGEPLSSKRISAIQSNVSSDFTGAVTAKGAIEYIMKQYNSAYQVANTVNTNSIYEPLFQQVAKETNVPVEILRAFAQKESSMNGSAINSGHIGLMQVSPELAASYGLNPYIDHDNIKTAALYYIANKRNNLIAEITNTSESESSMHRVADKILPLNHPFGTEIKQGYHIEFKTETKEVPVETFDNYKVFKNFKVNKTVFNFFLKNLQFSITNNNDGQLPDVVVKAKAK